MICKSMRFSEQKGWVNLSRVGSKWWKMLKLYEWERTMTWVQVIDLAEDMPVPTRQPVFVPFMVNSISTSGNDCKALLNLNTNYHAYSYTFSRLLKVRASRSTVYHLGRRKAVPRVSSLCPKWPTPGPTVRRWYRTSDVILIYIIGAILEAETQLKDIVQNLYNLIVQSYDHHGSRTQEAMKREMYVRTYKDSPSYIDGD